MTPSTSSVSIDRLHKPPLLVRFFPLLTPFCIVGEAMERIAIAKKVRLGAKILDKLRPGEELRGSDEMLQSPNKSEDVYNPTWIANRDNPIPDNSFKTFNISQAGYMTLYKDDRPLIIINKGNPAKGDDITLSYIDANDVEGDKFAYCDESPGFDSSERSQGCIPGPKPSNCKGSGSNDFEQYGINDIITPDNSLTGKSLSLVSDCREICRKECSCVAYDFFEMEASCLFYQKDVVPALVKPGEGITRLILYVRRSVVLQKDGYDNDEAVDMYEFGTEMVGDLLHDDNVHNSDSRGKIKNREQPFFGFWTIKIATDNFCEQSFLGRGGFGHVYKAPSIRLTPFGTLYDGREIAVKRLSQGSKQGPKEFKTEVLLISKLQHRNLVRLLGCCIHDEERILVYEYLPNKSLDAFLYDTTKRHLLDWKIRFSIIEGIAQGLLYLHKHSRLKIIHRDLKASNVLLDSNMIPKISDFGTACVFGDNVSEAETGRIVGTYGYMSPEYAIDGLFSEKSDVFSFGVLVLAIVTGKKCGSLCSSENVLGYAWELWKNMRCVEMVEPGLGQVYSDEEVFRCVQVGLLCVQQSADDRPMMSEVV
ncbi:G-type lectin S-receptor-like serine/threonine-protein kinase B120 [Rutidosis leptorrhynchoides]|uniref:G-type lectin S-receptor-like serine/threonine-protein kinase B120 n=1 Tax=Rutidosis leptorrhynchoides TaxID=125765 RepID=UPI003A9A5EE7